MYVIILKEKVWMKTLIVVISQELKFQEFPISKSNTLNFYCKNINLNIINNDKR